MQAKITEEHDVRERYQAFEPVVVEPTTEDPPQGVIDAFMAKRIRACLAMLGVNEQGLRDMLAHKRTALADAKFKEMVCTCEIAVIEEFLQPYERSNKLKEELLELEAQERKLNERRKEIAEEELAIREKAKVTHKETVVPRRWTRTPFGSINLGIKSDISSTEGQ